MTSLKNGLVKTKSEQQPLIFSDARNASDHIKTPLWRKLSFGVGAMAYAMCSTIMGFYLSLFLLEVALLDPTYVLVIVLLGRIWDGITDPIVGFLCSRTKTKLGQFRPWLLLSAFPTSITYFFLWFVPHWSKDEVTFVYFLLVYFAMQTLLTCVHVPYTALTVHLSYNQKETDSVTMWRVIFELVGTLFGIGIYTASYSIFAKTKEDDCDDNNRTYDKHKEDAYRYHAVAIGVLIIIVLMITFLTVKEQKEETMKKTNISFIASIRETFGFKPYRELLFMMLFAWLAIAFVQGNFALYSKYALSLTDEYPYVVATLLVCSVCWMPVWQIVLNKFGKKTAFFCGMSILMWCLISLLFISYEPIIIFPLSIVSGAGVAVAYLVPWSMLPDVIDEATLQRGVRREELFYAFFVFGIKFSAGVTLAISTGIYKVAGYDQLSCDQPWSVPLMFKLLVSAPPIIFLLISFFFLWRYPITEETRAETRKKLNSRRKRTESEESPVAIRPRTPSNSSSYHNNNSDDGTLEGELQCTKI